MPESLIVHPVALSRSHLKFKNKIHAEMSEKGKHLAQWMQEITIIEEAKCSYKPHKHAIKIAAI